LVGSEGDASFFLASHFLSLSPYPRIPFGIFYQKNIWVILGFGVVIVDCVVEGVVVVTRNSVRWCRFVVLLWSNLTGEPATLASPLTHFPDGFWRRRRRQNRFINSRRRHRIERAAELITATQSLSTFLRRLSFWVMRVTALPSPIYHGSSARLLLHLS